MSAISFSNVLDKQQFDEREKRYCEIVKNYKKEEVDEFPKLLGMLINHMEGRIRCCSSCSGIAQSM